MCRSLPLRPLRRMHPMMPRQRIVPQGAKCKPASCSGCAPTQTCCPAGCISAAQRHHAAMPRQAGGSGLRPTTRQPRLRRPCLRLSTSGKGQATGIRHNQSACLKRLGSTAATSSPLHTVSCMAPAATRCPSSSACGVQRCTDGALSAGWSPQLGGLSLAAGAVEAVGTP